METITNIIIGLTLTMMLAHLTLYSFIFFIAKPQMHNDDLDGVINHLFFVSRFVLSMLPILYLAAPTSTMLTLFSGLIMISALTTYNFQQWWQFIQYEHARKAVGLIA